MHDRAQTSLSLALREPGLWIRRGIDVAAQQLLVDRLHSPALGELGRGEDFRRLVLEFDAELTRFEIVKQLLAKAGYGAMRAGRINVIPGVGIKIKRVMTALSPSRRFTGELSGRFVSRY